MIDQLPCFKSRLTSACSTWSATYITACSIDRLQYYLLNLISSCKVLQNGLQCPLVSQSGKQCLQHCLQSGYQHLCLQQQLCTCMTFRRLLARFSSKRSRISLEMDNSNSSTRISIPLTSEQCKSNSTTPMCPLIQACLNTVHPSISTVFNLMFFSSE